VRILYGVAGEGMGHATRSAVVAGHLAARGHTLRFVASGRAAAFLRARFPDVVEILGLELRYADGEVGIGPSVIHNIGRMPTILARAGAAWAQADAFDADLVVTDFDSFVQAWAATRGVPLLAVDNFRVIDRCEHPAWILGEDARDLGPAQALIRAKGVGASHYVVTTFYCPPIRSVDAATTTLVPPIVRPEIARLGRPGPDGAHVLVYQTARGDTRLLDALRANPRERFVVYGVGYDGTEGNVTCKPFSEDGFLADLANAKAVVANGGMSLLGEAVYLGKPVLSVPVRRHFEQCINARYIAALGYGETMPCFDGAALGAFLERAPAYAERLCATPAQDQNRVLGAVLDRLVPTT